MSWVTWSISNWQFLSWCLFFKSWMMGTRTSFSVSQQLRPKLSAKWILSILLDLPFTRKTEESVYFSILFAKLSNFTKWHLFSLKLLFWVKIGVILWIYSAFQAVISFSAWEKSRDSTHRIFILDHKVRS